jgi:hypothetical protein
MRRGVIFDQAWSIGIWENDVVGSCSHRQQQATGNHPPQQWDKASLETGMIASGKHLDSAMQCHISARRVAHLNCATGERETGAPGCDVPTTDPNNYPE